MLDNRNNFLSNLHGFRLSPLHLPSVFSYSPSLPHFLFLSFSARTGYHQLWIQSTALFSLAPHMETLRTWPLQVRLTHIFSFSIIMFLRIAARDKQHCWVSFANSVLMLPTVLLEWILFSHKTLFVSHNLCVFFFTHLPHLDSTLLPLSSHLDFFYEFQQATNNKFKL